MIYLAERCGTGWSENTETGKKATESIQYLISVDIKIKLINILDRNS